MIAVTNISKILWPSRPAKCGNCNYQPVLDPEDYSPGKELRTILAVGDGSPLGNRSFRNFFEHYDFELKHWVKKANNHETLEALFRKQ